MLGRRDGRGREPRGSGRRVLRGGITELCGAVWLYNYNISGLHLEWRLSIECTSERKHLCQRLFSGAARILGTISQKRRGRPEANRGLQSKRGPPRRCRQGPDSRDVRHDTLRRRWVFFFFLAVSWRSWPTRRLPFPSALPPQSREQSVPVLYPLPLITSKGYCHGPKPMLRRDRDFSFPR